MIWRHPGACGNNALSVGNVPPRSRSSSSYSGDHFYVNPLGLEMARHVYSHLGRTNPPGTNAPVEVTRATIREVPPLFVVFLVPQFRNLKTSPSKLTFIEKNEKNCYYPDEQSHGLGTRRESRKTNYLKPTILG